VDQSSEKKRLEQNAHYVQGLMDNLLQQCDRWLVTKSQTCVERAYNIVNQISRESLNQKQDVAKAQSILTKANMPSPPVELGKTNPAERRQRAQERTKWEEEWEAQVDNGRSALSRRSSQKDFMLGSIIGSNLETFANQKKQLQDTMEYNDNTSASDENANVEISNTVLEDAATKSAELVALAGKGGRFEGETMGIGGLDEVLSEIKRRIWVPLAAPPTLLKELGISPVRGLLLYGKPGCGKTLLARTVGQILSPARPVTVVSGPELMDKYVGSSEKNLREVFDNPPDVYDKSDKALAAAALHVVIMDECDAMMRSRGGKGGGGDQGDAGVARDSVVNQLLAKMDGVDALVVPTLVIGLTNKRSLIDTALLRPGRFEVQVEVPPPKTAAQRISILKVHTKQMLDAGRLLVRDAPAGTAAAQYVEKNNTVPNLLTYDELLGVLAAECEGMTGAELAGVARAAASHALERAVMEFSADPSHHVMMKECLVTQQDCEDAVHDVRERHANDWEQDEEETTPEANDETDESKGDSERQTSKENDDKSKSQ
jgi:SpoVK/Ycf46/Vps4 family AAA+-type ATPase